MIKVCWLTKTPFGVGDALTVATRKVGEVTAVQPSADHLVVHAKLTEDAPTSKFDRDVRHGRRSESLLRA